jgi:deazaflavin-dependent oxidoreductase (nitroreductase family)
MRSPLAPALSLRRRVRGRLPHALAGVPVALYRHGFGSALGHRLLLLHHMGRRSGLERHAVLEIVGWNHDFGEVFVVAGFGPRTDWYRNVLAAGGAVITRGRATMPVTVRVVPAGEAAAVIARYETGRLLPAAVVRAALSSLVGWRYDGSDAARARLVRQLPMLALHPVVPFDDRTAEGHRTHGDHDTGHGATRVRPG